MNSSYKDHGLDSLDLIELIIRADDDLGHVIDADNLQNSKSHSILLTLLSVLKLKRLSLQNYHIKLREQPLI